MYISEISIENEHNRARSLINGHKMSLEIPTTINVLGKHKRASELAGHNKAFS